MKINCVPVKNSEFETYNIVSKHQEILRARIKEIIEKCYTDMMNEIERSKIDENRKLIYQTPKMDKMIKTVFEFSYAQLHRGGRIKAYEILEDLREGLLEI